MLIYSSVLQVGTAGDMGNKPGAQSQSEEETEVPAARVPPLTSHPGTEAHCFTCTSRNLNTDTSYS